MAINTDQASGAAGRTAPRRSRRVRWTARLRSHQWSPLERAGLIAAIAIAMGSLFVTTYSLALGDPVPRRIEAALVGDPGTDAAALHAIDLQRVYAALDLTSPRPTLYLASAGGASVARVLQKAASIDPRVRVVDTHPLRSTDPSGLDIFYLMLVATIIGFITVFQTRALAGALPLRHWAGFVVAFALAAALCLTMVDGPILNRLDLPVLEVWGILTVHIAAVASFASVMAVLMGRWAMVPTWLFFVVLGNSSSGGAVSPPLLPAPFAFISQWLPSGATVTSLRDAVYYPSYQHARPMLVLAAWAAALFATMLFASHHLRTSPGGS